MDAWGPKGPRARGGSSLLSSSSLFSSLLLWLWLWLWLLLLLLLLLCACFSVKDLKGDVERIVGPALRSRQCGFRTGGSGELGQLSQMRIPYCFKSRDSRSGMPAEMGEF